MNKKPKVVHFKKEPYDVYIARPSKWGNDYSHKEGTLAKYKVRTVREAIANYKRDLLSNPKLLAEVKKELKGKILGCWCKPGPCHGDVLLQIANEPENEFF
jgi:hypothetical protein